MSKNKIELTPEIDVDEVLKAIEKSATAIVMSVPCLRADQESAAERVRKRAWDQGKTCHAVGV